MPEDEQMVRLMSIPVGGPLRAMAIDSCSRGAVVELPARAAFLRCGGAAGMRQQRVDREAGTASAETGTRVSGGSAAGVARRFGIARSGQRVSRGDRL